MNAMHLVAVLFASVVFGSASADSDRCDSNWTPGFSSTLPGVSGTVNAIAEYKSRDGAAIILGGTITKAGVIACNRVVGWNGNWFTLGEGMNGTVNALAAFDDGNGMALFAGGAFTTAGGVPALRIARWDGHSWSAVGDGVNADVHALHVFDDGSGPRLYAGGHFTQAGGVFASRVAKWNGNAWEAVSPDEVSSTVKALASFNDGDSTHLIAGGFFQVPTSRIAKLVNGRWQPLGSGLNGEVFALASFDDADGPQLFVGGNFSQAGGVQTSDIARWNGTQWSSAGDGFNGQCRALEVFDSGNGPILIAGGLFQQSGENEVRKLARWTGATWEALGLGLTSNTYGEHVYALGTARLQGDDHATLFVGGEFDWVDGGFAASCAKWDGTRWWRLHAENGAEQPIYNLYPVDLGKGSHLYAEGVFGSVGNVLCRQVARWDGQGWQHCGAGIDPGDIRTRCVFDDGTGPALYIAGSIPSIRGIPVNNIARWDGESWTAVGGGTNGTIHSLAIFDDGEGSALYAGGAFTVAGGVSTSCIARWNGRTWSRLRRDVTGVSGGEIRALATFGHETSAKLYVAGTFTAANGDPSIHKIASWNGHDWSALGQGVSGSVNALDVFDGPMSPSLYVRSLAATEELRCWDGDQWTMYASANYSGKIDSLILHDDGSGPAIFVCGSFHALNGMSRRGIAKWNGEEWLPVGSGLQACAGGICEPRIKAMAVMDDGSPDGPSLFVGGLFAEIGGQAAKRMAKWNGTTWSAVGQGIPAGMIFSLQPYRGSGPMALYCGGSFNIGPPQPAHFARWEICDPESPPGQFDLIMPYDGSIIPSLTPNLQWSQSPGRFVRYDARVATNFAMTDGVFKANGLLGFEAAVPAGILEFGRTYTWQVSAHNPLGAQESETWTFRIMANPDIDADGEVDIDDLLFLLSAWGSCPSIDSCNADVDFDGAVGVSDLLLLLQHLD